MKVSRRKFLKTKGAMLTLPFLHSLPDLSGAEAPKEKPAKKLVIMYVPNGLVRRCFFPGEEKGELPGFVGGFNADKFKNKKRVQNKPGIYPLELTSTMQPLAEHTKDVSLVTGLDRTFKNGQDVHAQGASCYLTSLSPVQAAAQGIRIIPVAASGVDKGTEFLLRFIDISTGGTYSFLTDDSGIGNSHIEPTVGSYQVELLNDLLGRLVLDAIGQTP